MLSLRRLFSCAALSLAVPVTACSGGGTSSSPIPLTGTPGSPAAASGVRVPSLAARRMGASGVHAGAVSSGFSAMSVTLTHSLLADTGAQVANFAQAYGITTIFLPVSGQDVANLLAGNPATVANMNALLATGQVYLETGSTSWMASPNTVPQAAQTLVQQVAPHFPQLAGIVYAIDATQDPAWFTNQPDAISRYFTLLDTLFANNMTFGQTLVTTSPQYSRAPNRTGSKSPSMLQAVEGYSQIAGTVLIVPGNNESFQLSRATNSVSQLQKPFWTFASTSPYGTTYHGTSPANLQSNLSQLGSAIASLNPNSLGIGVSSWNDLADSLQSVLPQPAYSGPVPDGKFAPPAGSSYVGAFVDPSGPAGPDNVANFEAQIGRTLAFDLHYHGWTDEFPMTFEQDDAAHGRIPVIAWNCGDSNANVAAGRDDAIIGAKADAIKAFGQPVFLRYLWEMNLPSAANGRSKCYDPNTDLPGGYFSPAEFIAAWNHIHAVFAAHGVTNVAWLWNPSGGGQGIADYYPGDANVDWVGVDIYDRENISMTATFAPIIGDVTQFGKPIMVAETGANPSNQAAFFSNAASTLQAQYPQIRAFSYLDSPGAHGSWTLDGDGISGYTALATAPGMQAMSPAVHPLR